MVAELVKAQSKNLGCKVATSLDDVVDIATSWAKSGDLVMTVGAGSIYRCAPMIVDRLAAVGVES